MRFWDKRREFATRLQLKVPNFASVKKRELWNTCILNIHTKPASTAIMSTIMNMSRDMNMPMSTIMSIITDMSTITMRRKRGIAD